MNKLYYISDWGNPKTHCVDSILKIGDLIKEIHTDIDNVDAMILEGAGESMTVTFYYWPEDRDITYDIETIEIDKL